MPLPWHTRQQRSGRLPHSWAATVGACVGPPPARLARAAHQCTCWTQALHLRKARQRPCMRVTRRESARAGRAGAPTRAAAAPHGSAARRGGQRRRRRGGSRRRPATRTRHIVSLQRAASIINHCARRARQTRRPTWQALQAQSSGHGGRAAAGGPGGQPSMACVAAASSARLTRPAPSGKRSPLKHAQRPEARAGLRLGRARRHAQRQEGARALVIRERLQRPQLHAEPAGRPQVQGSGSGCLQRAVCAARVHARHGRAKRQAGPQERLACQPAQGRGALQRLKRSQVARSAGRGQAVAS